MTNRKQTLIAIALATAAATIYGWHLFFFLTDDSFIDFRYISNSLMGVGLVWNAPPFRPVEGYTSFLWVLLLREVWQLTGRPPPDVAGVVSLLFGLGTLFLAARMVLRMWLPAKLERARLAFLCLMLVWTVTNRTFLAWLSSGLETALFNFLFTWWIYEGTRPEGVDRPATLVRLTLAAALCEMCRPDGLLIMAATIGQVILIGWLQGVRWLRFASPLLIVPAHLLWRWHTYGDWVPNTYRAKFVQAWPEAGIRYVASFIIEYGLWWWLLIALVWALGASLPKVRSAKQLVAAAPIVVVVFHWGYYTFAIGGDHFEYRVYSHLIPLLFIAAIWFVARLTDRVVMAAGYLLVLLVASWPIPWLHWRDSQAFTTRSDTFRLIVPVADHFPSPLRSIVREWDSWQVWLVMHSDGMRHQEHKQFWKYQIGKYPPRDEGAAFGRDQRLIYATRSVGVPGWALPHVNIIDEHGLNDWVIARYGQISDYREMAHERMPPEGYLECFRHNLYLRGGTFHVREELAPVTDAEVRACESRDWSSAAAGTLAPEE